MAEKNGGIIVNDEVVETKQNVCGCGRSPTGFCVGLHALNDEEYDRFIMEGHVYPGELIKEEKKADESQRISS